MIGLLVAIPAAIATFIWLLIPAEITELSPDSPASSEAPTLAELAKRARCISEPVNVTGETYKCATARSGDVYFVVRSANPSAQAPIPSEGAAAGTLERGGEPPATH